MGDTNQFINNEERVKVDRRRFEQMLASDADSFFRRVMRSTNTQIMWPPMLKPGTKSKKDPHVRITGSPNSINAAKEIIFEQLDTRRNRVTLKMDVAFTDHSHIIGKGGRSIQRVMDETGCHIHFPDSNRTNMAEKSNQVSIAGSAEGVEQSRRRIREMLPITLQFDLPLNNGLHSPPTLDPQSPQLQAIQQSYGITITFRCDGSKCNNNSYFASSRIISVAVRGARSHLFGLRQGLSILIEYLTGFRANTINVPLTMTIDVAMQHHPFIAGRANCNLRAIMQSTGAVIMMPDLNDSIDQSISNTLSGSCGSLTSVNELAATLSVASSSGSASSAAIAALASSLDDNNNSNSMTSPQQQSLSFMTALTNSNTKFNNNNNSLSINNNNIINTINSLTNNNATTIINNDNNDNNQTYRSGKLINSLGATSTLSSTSSSHHSINNRKTAIVIRGPNFDSVYNAWQELLGQLPLILIFDLKEGQDVDPVQVTKLMEQMRQISILIKPKQRQNTKSIVVRGPEKDSRLLFEVRRQILKLDSESSQADINQQQQQLKQHAKLTQQLTNQLLAQQQQHQIRQQQQNQNQHQQQQQQQQQQQHPHQQQQVASGSSRQPPQISQLQQQQQNAELQMKAIRAILEPNLRKARQPTPYWAGLGFSKSVSEPMIKEKLSVGPLFASNLVDDRRTSYANENAIHDLAVSLQSLPLTDQQSHSQKITDCLKLAIFLSKVGLVSYLSLFKGRGIDLEMLLSFSEADLAELGLPYVHRHKLAIAIAEEKSSIQNEQQRAALSALSSTFDAAPGAERSRRQKAEKGPGELNDIWSM